MTDDKFYSQVFNDVKDYLVRNSKYSPVVLKGTPQKMNIAPLVIIPRPEITFDSENLSKREQKFFCDFEFNIYAKNIIGAETLNKNAVADELRQLVDDIMFDRLGMRRAIDRQIPNLDADLYRHLLRYTCLLDKDKNIIYRR